MNKNVNVTNVTNNKPKSSKYDHLEEKWREVGMVSDLTSKYLWEEDNAWLKLKTLKKVI